MNYRNLPVIVVDILQNKLPSLQRQINNVRHEMKAKLNNIGSNPTTKPNDPAAGFQLDQDGKLINLNDHTIQHFIDNKLFVLLPNYMLFLDNGVVKTDYNDLADDEIDQVVKIIYNNSGTFNNEDYEAGCPFTFDNCKEIIGIGNHTKKIVVKYVNNDNGYESFYPELNELTYDADPFPNINRICPNVEIVDLRARESYIGSITVRTANKIEDDKGRFKRNYSQETVEQYYYDGYDCVNSPWYFYPSFATATQDKDNYIGSTCSHLHTVLFDPNRVTDINWLGYGKNITTMTIPANSDSYDDDSRFDEVAHNDVKAGDYGYNKTFCYEGFQGNTLVFDPEIDYSSLTIESLSGYNKYKFTSIEGLNQSAFSAIRGPIYSYIDGEHYYIKNWDLYNSDITCFDHFSFVGDSIRMPRHFNPSSSWYGTTQQFSDSYYIEEELSDESKAILACSNVKEIDMTYCDDFIQIAPDYPLFNNYFRKNVDIYMPYDLNYICDAIMFTDYGADDPINSRIHFFDAVEWYEYDKPMSVYYESWENYQTTNEQPTIVIHYRTGYNNLEHPIYLKYVEFGLADKIEFVEHNIESWDEFRPRPE